MFAVTDFCQSPLKRSLVQQTIGFMQGLADGNDFRGCRALHTSSRLCNYGVVIPRAPLEDQLWFRLQRQVLGIPQHKQRQISVNATAVDDALKLSSVTDSACCCSLRSLSAENRQYN
uniref:Uncharacterized protein n=1 Tax=Aegilops tauschii subsp. strangulata TaxID=200361 RepID=A0A453E4M2_AEGTS